MRQVYARLDPLLLRRVRVAAACQDVSSASDYARRIILRWYATPEGDRPVLAPVDNEDLAIAALRFTVSDAIHEQLRVSAALLSISVSTAVVRILHHHVPYEMEAVARVLTGEKLPEESRVEV